ncbi:Protein of unknown function [Bacillus wiedmannii]|nr:Protein of unknown function [Bacillus wiedmannii]
MKKNYLQH